MHTIMYVIRTSLLLFAATVSSASATTWYVNGVNGSDRNDCRSRRTACKTIGYAISLAASGDSIKVAPATYGGVNIPIDLNVIGAGATKTIIDGGGPAISVPGTTVTLSGLTITHGNGGIYNQGTLTITNSAIVGNQNTSYGGGGIENRGAITINNSTVSGNSADNGNIAEGGGIRNSGTMTINNSTISGNSAQGKMSSTGGNIFNFGALTVSNSTISEGTAQYGGDISNTGTVTFQNSIVADSPRENCAGTMTSNGYNLSSDNTCNFNNRGDLNNTNPKLGHLQNNGGPTQTQALLARSPAIDAGNPGGCTDDQGNLLVTDQRGKQRPDKEDTSGCDIGAYERQKD